MTDWSAPPRWRGEFREDSMARAVYAEAAGIGRAIPRAVAIPRDATDVERLVAWAAEYRVSLVPRGSGSSMGGGAIGDGVIVDLGRLRDIGPLNAASQSIFVGAGVLQRELSERASGAGLRFPVAPSSADFCTVGGMAATNAAGAHSMRFGSMRRWVRALDCVFADGMRATIRRDAAWPTLPVLARVRAARDDLRHELGEDVRSRLSPAGVRKDSSGYALESWLARDDLIDLLVGSEGTLALFVGVEVALAPRPRATASALGAFETIEAAATAATAAVRAGAAACELLDRTFLDVASEGGQPLPVPAHSEAVLLAECEGDSAEAAAAAIGKVAAAFEATGAVQVALALTSKQEHELWLLRHRASPILSRLHPKLASMQFIEDGAVPPARLPAYVRGVREILDRHGVRGVLFGHAGDAHVHVNPLVDVSLPDWRERVEAIFAEVVELTATLGGTLAGEHGDGRLRTPMLPRLRGEAGVAVYERVKRAFDPDGILNPGVKVPLMGQRPIEAVKYDPALPPLPTPARAALDRVVRERCYQRPRLELLTECSDAHASLPGMRGAQPSDVEGEAVGELTSGDEPGAARKG